MHGTETTSACHSYSWWCLHSVPWGGEALHLSTRAYGANDVQECNRESPDVPPLVSSMLLLGTQPYAPRSHGAGGGLRAVNIVYTLCIRVSSGESSNNLLHPRRLSPTPSQSKSRASVEF